MRNNLNGILAEIESAELQIKELKSQKEKLESEALVLIADDIQDQIGKNDYGCGTATIELEEYKVKAVVSKKVTWDQDQLAILAERIKASGDNPLEYVKVKYEVLETKFKNWPTVIQDEFINARTVAASKPALKIERRKFND